MKLFTYSHPRRARRTLDKLQAAWPENKFKLVPELHGFGWNILATRPDGTSGRVKKVPLMLIYFRGCKFE